MYAHIIYYVIILDASVQDIASKEYAADFTNMSVEEYFHASLTSLNGISEKKHQIYR